jgi:hypothetical protein
MINACLVLLVVLSTSDPSLSDLQQGVIDREAAIRGFRATCHIDTFADDPKTRLNLTASEDVKFSAEITGRLRYESSGDVKDQGIAKYEMVLGSFNGSEARSMRNLGAAQYAAAVVSRERSSVRFRVDPCEFVTSYFHEPISADLKSRNVTIVGRENWDGRPTVVVEVEYDPPPNSTDNRKSRFWIDPSRGFAVVRWAALTRISPPNDEWCEYYHVDGFDYKEVQSGVWLPMRVVMETLKAKNKDPALRKKPIFGYKIQMKEWELNPSFDDAEFTIAFAKGIGVENQISGTSYFTRQITDQDLSDQLTMERLTKEAIPPKSRRWLLLWVNGAAALTWVSVIVYRRARRRARP